MTTRRLDRYTTGAIVLHWLIAAMIVFQVILAWRMVDRPRTPEVFALIQLHKSVGITILVLSVIRLGWRLAFPPPPLPAEMPLWEKLAAKATHWGFYVIMIGSPLTGWLMVSLSKTRIPTLLYGKVPLPFLPGTQALEGAQKHGLHTFAELSHTALGWLLYGLLALHVLAALKHQLFNRDRVLAHMAPGAKPGAWLEPRLWLIALGFAAVVAGGYALRLGMAPAAPAPSTSPAEPAAPIPVSTPAPAPASTAPPVAATPASTPAAAAEPSVWKTAKGSKLGFKTTWSGQAIEGRFDRWNADIRFSPDALDKSKVSVSVDMTSAATGDAQRDATLPSGDWFDADRHPKAVFTATSFRKTGADRYLASGRLSLRGASKPVSLPFTLKIDGDRARMDGVTRLDRTAFGVGQGEWSSTDQIPAQVTVTVGLTATRG